MRSNSVLNTALYLTVAAFSVGASAETTVAAKATAVSFQPTKSAPATQTQKNIANATGDLVFSAPPRGSKEEEFAAYQPVVEFLSKVVGRTVVYQYSDNWLSYSKDMTEGRYDIVFDGPAFNGWRIERMGHTPLVKLPDDFVFVVVARNDQERIKTIKDLAGRKVCAHAPPNLGTLTLQAQFDNPAREPWIVEVKGWDNSYKAMMSGQCIATVLPIKNLKKNDDGPNRVTKTLYQHKAMPNQAISVGQRIPPEMHAKIAAALLSDEGKRATEKMRAPYAGKQFVQATRTEYAGLGDLLKSSIYYH